MGASHPLASRFCFSPQRAGRSRGGTDATAGSFGAARSRSGTATQTASTTGFDSFDAFGPSSSASSASSGAVGGLKLSAVAMTSSGPSGRVIDDPWAPGSGTSSGKGGASFSSMAGIGARAANESVPSAVSDQDDSGAEPAKDPWAVGGVDHMAVRAAANPPPPGWFNDTKATAAAAKAAAKGPSSNLPPSLQPSAASQQQSGNNNKGRGSSSAAGGDFGALLCNT
jgi:hypothetical protein